MARPASPHSIQIAAQFRAHLFHIVPPGVELHDVVDGAYWVNAGKEIAHRPWCLIECVASSGLWECTLRVVSAAFEPSRGVGDIVVRLVSSWQINEALPDIPDGYRLRQNEYLGTWTVVRTIEPQLGLIRDALANEGDARRCAIEHHEKLQLILGSFEQRSLLRGDIAPSHGAVDPSPAEQLAVADAPELAEHGPNQIEAETGPPQPAARRGRPPSNLSF